MSSKILEVFENPRSNDVHSQHIGKIPKLKPVKTRKNMSKFEFAGVITKLANYLSTLDSLDKYVEEVSIPEFINNSELAYKLLLNGTFNAVIDRLGYEQVTFSELKINPLWIKTLDNYYERNREALYNNLYKPYDQALNHEQELIKQLE